MQPAKHLSISKKLKGVLPMNTLLNLLSAAAVVITGTVASTAPVIDTSAQASTEVIQRTLPTLPAQPVANSAARTAAFFPLANSIAEPAPVQIEINPGATERWVF